MEKHLNEVYQKAASFCAYQERTHDEVRQKLATLYVLPDDAEQIVARLIEENFLNEQRYAESYAGGKFRLKKWGKRKILSELKRRNLSEYTIRTAMKQIDEDDYKATLQRLAQNKAALLSKKESNTLLLKKKLVTFLLQKGYELDSVMEVVRQTLDNGDYRLTSN